MLRYAVLIFVFITLIPTTECWDVWGYFFGNTDNGSTDEIRNEINNTNTEENYQESTVRSPTPVRRNTSTEENYDESITRPSFVRSDGPKPYYFGSMSLNCLLMHHILRKRSAQTQEVDTLTYSHSFLFYDNFHFELGKDSHVYYGSDLPSDDMCHSTIGMTPSGYSIVDVDCIKNCSDSYIARYGSYNVYKNNCHLFVNRMARILNGYKCPAWCEN